MLPVQPNFLAQPFAVNGARNQIPATADESAGLASFDQGFPNITELPIKDGGLPPQRKDFNGILHLLSQFSFWAQSGGLYTYSATLNYIQPCCVYLEGKIYMCVATNGPETSNGVKNPKTEGKYWLDLLTFLGGMTASEINKKLDELTDKVDDTIASIPKPKATSIGNYTTLSGAWTESFTWVATSDGFVSGTTGHNDSASIYVNGLEVYFTSGRSKYGQGSVGFCVPIKKGATFKSNGPTNWIRFVPLIN